MPCRAVQAAGHRLATDDMKPLAGIAADSEKADALMRWQPAQWQAMVISGGAFTSIRTWPQRQPPTRGRAQSVISASLLRRPWVFSM